MLNIMKIHLIKKPPKFKVGDHVRISKYKITFAKEYTRRKKFLLLIKFKIQFLGHMLLVI